MPSAVGHKHNEGPNHVHVFVDYSNVYVGASKLSEGFFLLPYLSLSLSLSLCLSLLCLLSQSIFPDVDVVVGGAFFLDHCIFFCGQRSAY